ncbi:hypothetical protein M6B38_112995 [Iris pallida]|uniref:Uncharacterized protein n=1 Tax=Iris pallida TaxID=29817 RepID=A0AAX6IM03_IRIPA|nr:hypothetical protein M6B38_112995 [Iris pallida]
MARRLFSNGVRLSSNHDEQRRIGSDLPATELRPQRRAATTKHSISPVAAARATSDDIADRLPGTGPLLPRLRRSDLVSTTVARLTDFGREMPVSDTVKLCLRIRVRPTDSRLDFVSSNPCFLIRVGVGMRSCRIQLCGSSIWVVEDTIVRVHSCLYQVCVRVMLAP